MTTLSQHWELINTGYIDPDTNEGVRACMRAAYYNGATVAAKIISESADHDEAIRRILKECTDYAADM